MDLCLGYVNAYIWTPNCHVMTNSFNCTFKTLEKILLFV